MANINEDSIEIETPISVGERLKKIREEKNLSTAEVAAQLRLMKDNIDALETGGWDRLHGRAYARGYFTSYVKFLSLDEDEFLAAFNREYQSSASETSLSNVSYVKEAKNFPWARWLVIFILLAITWFAYQQWLAFEVEKNKEDAQSAIENSSSGDDRFRESIVEPIAESNEENMLASVDTEVVLATSDVALTPEPAEAIVDRVESETQLPVESAEVVAPIVEKLIDETVTSGITPVVLPLETHIALSFSQDCWVSIADVDKQLLINKLMKATTRLELTGKAPLTISLGHASAVNMKVNDKPFDLSTYTQGDVAKFILEGES